MLSALDIFLGYALYKFTFYLLTYLVSCETFDSACVMCHVTCVMLCDMCRVTCAMCDVSCDLSCDMFHVTCFMCHVSGVM